MLTQDPVTEQTTHHGRPPSSGKKENLADKIRCHVGRKIVTNAHFFGGYEHTLDDKNRFILPQSFRAGLGERFFLCKGMNDKCLWILPEDEFTSLLDRMKERIPKSDQRGQKWIALFTESAVDRTLDKFNRLTLPGSLLEYAGITGKIKVYGHDERVEIWAQERWQETMAEEFDQLSADMFTQYAI